MKKYDPTCRGDENKDCECIVGNFQTAIDINDETAKAYLERHDVAVLSNKTWTFKSWSKQGNRIEITADGYE